jgi:hypothetical protein
MVVAVTVNGILSFLAMLNGIPPVRAGKPRNYFKTILSYIVGAYNALFLRAHKKTEVPPRGYL